MSIDFDIWTALLKKLISTPSVSGKEFGTAGLLQEFLHQYSIDTIRKHNNIIVRNKYFDPVLKTILLNSHHDTVQPVVSWKRDPFKATTEGDRIYGVGSNDAGGSLISLLAVFLKYYDMKNLKMNILLVLSGEEEISGERGVASILPDCMPVEFGIVGEPTAMAMAVAEKGLIVLDCIANGDAGHAARSEGHNAIYSAMEDIAWFRNFSFPKISEKLGPVKMSVTMISAGTQHNMIPDRCNFTVDIRTTDAYSHEEIMGIIESNVACEVKARSVRLRPSGIPDDHILAVAGKKTGLRLFGSDALSDQALMPFPTVKIGPGDPLRSHKADEFIKIDEIKDGIKVYERLLDYILK